MVATDIMTLVKGRRSIRNFTPEQVSADDITDVLDAAIWAPSGSNSQSWLFTAVSRKSILNRINRIVKEAMQRWEPDDDYPAKAQAKEKSFEEGYNFFYGAPTLIIATNKIGYQNGIVDCAMALQNLMLAAFSMGLGTCYVNQIYWLRNDPEVVECLSEFGIPADHVVCGSLAIGHPVDAPTAPERIRGTINIVR
ncbi:MAG: nitroreductase family protein [Clostridiales bacterium]|jgi:nitroreductase|nr:nitroreductase family protein [Clostridiales bacterium]